MTRRSALTAALLLLALSAGVLLGVLLAGRNGPNAADVGFARDMTTHHRQAIEMATLAREQSEDPAVQLLAYDIESGQTAQVGQMQGWLAAWGETPNTTEPMMGWMGHELEPGEQMPGMAAPEEVERLRTLEGEEFDREFLRLMRAHHFGGLDMAAVGAREANRPEARTLAQKIEAAQSSEVELLDQMLAERGGGQSSPDDHAPGEGGEGTHSH